MAITYEEALSTLTAMFGEPWTKETLDQVLRHHEGHMENTVESVLGHGDGDPAALTQQLKFSKPNDGSNNTSNSVDAATEDVSMDEQFARQLEDEERRNSLRNQGQTRMKNNQSAAPIRQQQTAPITLATSKGRGTPTELPSDFLRVPGSAANGSSSSSGTAMDEDEKLARMLQDELFSEELARNPQFAHLTTGPTGRVKRPTNSPAFVTNGDGRPLGQQGRQVIDKIGEMGTEAKKKLQLFAANFHAKKNNRASAKASAGSNVYVHESRGLLDNDDFGLETPSTSDNHMEMGDMGFGSKKSI